MNDEYFDVPENNDGTPLFYNPHPIFTEDAEIDEVQLTAKNSFGINYLYPWQRIVIANILDAVKSKELSTFYQNQVENGQLTKEELNEIIYDQDGNERGKQIVLLPTGAGKSLCFLVPSLLINGPTLILYPLLALMSDQQRRMEEGNMEIVVFKGQQSNEQRKANFEKLKNGAKVILANPEVLQSEKLLEEIAKFNIKHIAIDEAHCVSEWGDTFRPAYTTVGNIIKKLGNPVVTAFTATASPTVLERISKIMFDGNAHIVQSDSDRPNIIYHVVKTASKEKTALEYAEKSEKPLIVFCSTRKRAENLSKTFAEYFGYDKVKFYHAGLEKSEKDKIEKWFFPKDDAILCSTCAFGMGVDKKNIRTVIHLDPPPTAESYIQEAGRGGRDGKTSNAILLWSYENKLSALKHPENSRERVLYKFAESTDCRRQILLDALGGEQAVCSGCDNCFGTSIHYAQDEKIALKFIKRFNKNFSIEEMEQKLQDVFNNQNVQNKQLRYWEIYDVRQIMKSLFEQEKIKVCKFPWKDKVKIVSKRENDKKQT
ncbi:MAG: RecQ family ATP-dependent DNA helicase [Treponemataceae bacterium]|nr:RecQ family ATP-dependent DNA helicase [Treponemataceae bacterium]